MIASKCNKTVGKLQMMIKKTRFDLDFIGK